MKKWAAEYEAAIDGQLQAHGQRPMKPNCHGRAQRLEPEVQDHQSPICRPSREGEVALQCTLVGTAVRSWFKQLRRIQSLCHAIQANKTTPSAVSYRASLWTAILKAPGFYPNFITWWGNRDSPCDGAPICFPDRLPTNFDAVHVLYVDFLHHFRKFESWHNRQRQASLKAKYEGSLSSIYKDLRDEPKGGIDHVWKDVKYQILAVDHDHSQLMLDGVINTNLTQYGTMKTALFRFWQSMEQYAQFLILPTWILKMKLYREFSSAKSTKFWILLLNTGSLDGTFSMKFLTRLGLE